MASDPESDARPGTAIPAVDPPGDVPVLLTTHLSAMRHALSLARRSPCLPTNFRVGAVIVGSRSRRVAATGFTLELAGNTHAEEVCLLKLAASLGCGSVEELPVISWAEPHILYTTVEPCYRRLSGKRPCLDRVLEQRSWIGAVVYGFREPAVFVSDNASLDVLRREGVEVVHVPGLEAEIRAVATEGHSRPPPQQQEDGDGDGHGGHGQSAQPTERPVRDPSILA